MDLSQQKLIAITTKYFTKQDIGLHILATKKITSYLKHSTHKVYRPG